MFENKIGQPFENLGRRIIYSYLATYPEFKPNVNCDVSELSQKQCTTFCMTLLI